LAEPPSLPKRPIVNTIVKTLPHDLEEALAELDREYLLGAIDRDEWGDRRDSHIAWFEERGIRDERDAFTADAGA